MQADLYSTNENCDSIPALNTEIVNYTKNAMGKKVNTGECWDLAAEALKANAAKWDGMYKFGNEVDPKAECIFPGDIIQFKDVQVKYKKGNATYTESMPHHTAIVYKVNGKGDYEIAHQNYSEFGRKVGVSSLALQNVTKGKLTFYRPVK